MSEQSEQKGAAGTSDHPQHRAAEGEGVRRDVNAPDHAEHSIFDGAGNESVVVTVADDEGRVSQGTGRSSEDAMKDAKAPGDMLGKDFSPKHQ